ncbi:ArnT family glycosyltransferase [Gillisia sp. JM1]|uniref:ArnT family glycosyltransferase n=1 Tax=Gillisia sp. JM1 TaxID=1283286 RepID=UPI0004075CBE|nr:glycosyltransferase family 39 protein [Gillisia sp. JM1]
MQVKLFKLLFLLFVVFNIGLGSFGLAETSEARYAEISKEMVKSGDYLHPNLLGIKHYHKPPLPYYITSVGYKIFGINEFGARFFLGIALLLQIYLVYKIALLVYKNEKIAYASALIYTSLPIVLIAARNLTTDTFLTTFILWSIYLWLLFKHLKKIRFFYGFFIALGLAFLTKGPVGLIPPFFFIICWNYYNKERIKLSAHFFIGILLMLAISCSWFLAIIIDDPKVWDYFIQEQIINRATNAEQFHRTQPIWYYLVLIPALGLPWIIFIVVYSRKKSKQIWRESAINKTLIMTAISLLILFSLFSSKLILYILPVFSFIAILGGHLIFKFSEKQLKWFSWVYYASFGVLIFGLIASQFSTNIEVPLLSALLLIAISLGGMLFIIKFTKIEASSKLLNLGFFFVLILFLVHTVVATNNAGTINSFKDIAQFIQKEKGKELKSVVVFDDLIPSASFYLDADIITVRANNYHTFRETQFEKYTLYKKNYININVPT